MDVQETFETGGVLVMTSASGWSGLSRLTAHDLGKEESEIPDIFTLGNKHLLDKETELLLIKPRQKISSLMDRMAKPFLIGKAIHFVPNKNLIPVKEGLEKIRTEQAEIVESVINDLDSIRIQRIAEYPQLADAKWPMPDSIRKSFGVRWVVCQIKAASVTETDLDEVIAIKQQAAGELKEAFGEWKDNILKDVQMSILEVCKDLTEKLKNGEKITESTMKKPRRVIEDYLNVGDLFDLPAVKAEVAKLKGIIDKADPAQLRADWKVSKDFAEALKKLGDNIGDLTGLSSDGSVKRIVKKAA